MYLIVCQVRASIVVVNNVVSIYSLQYFKASVDYDCIACPLAKAHKLSFHMIHQQYKIFFDLLYIDI